MSEREREGVGPEEIRRDIEDTREALGQKLEALETRARETLDINHHMETHPWVVLGISTGAGFVAGALLPGGKRTEDGVRPEAEARPSPMESPRALSHARQGSGGSEILSRVKVAAMSVLAGYARQLARNYSPRWGAELDRAWEQYGVDELFQRYQAQPSPRSEHPGNAPETVRPPRAGIVQ